MNRVTNLLNSVDYVPGVRPIAAFLRPHHQMVGRLKSAWAMLISRV